MTIDRIDSETDLDVLEAITQSPNPIAMTEELLDQLSISEDELLEQLKTLSRNGLIEVEQYHDERGWRLTPSGRSTLESDRLR